MLLRLAYLGVTSTFAMLRLLPMSDPRAGPQSPGRPRRPGRTRLPLEAGQWDIPRVPLRYDRAVIAGAVLTA
ncbi:hypothetical protein [Streptomyces sp. NBC_01727]|uniref:hypothetical protein n=1 Tax=Streptomyces sp. NBC_01727 TaxID=2975924 RepID=UPI002E11F4BB|nr:hypothetical protein OIE76_00560 [Streptomyces sp. NBC_01727]